MIKGVNFVSISVKEYIRLHMKNNPSEDRKLLEEGLKEALAYALAGKKCSRGNAIWVIGAEACPDEDYEIDQHIQYVNRGFQKR